MILTILSGFLAYLILLMFKNQNTYRQREKIIDAVYAYNLQCIKEHRFSELISYDCMRDYNSSLLDIFDWGGGTSVLCRSMYII